MSWRSEWRAISDRIGGLIEASEFYVRCTAINSSDPPRLADNILIPRAKEVLDAVGEYRARCEHDLPAAARDCADRFLESASQFVAWGSVKGLFAVQAALTVIADFRAEFEYHVSDFSAVARRLTERAFTHLQRFLVADENVAERWQAAFAEHETKCEKLGAVHLLHHGIWAFKVDAIGERTDLVLGEPLADLTEAERTAEALVLTEWKRVSNAGDVSAKIEEALAQARRYSVGSLAGFELAEYRYLVLVSKTHIELPADNIENDVIYRHINIAVDPAPPSKA